MEHRRTQLVGNRLALAGTILYFLEWVVIVFLVDPPTDLADGQAIVDAYDGKATITAFAAGWFSFVLLGRVLFSAALRKAFRDSGRDSLLMDFAVGAMIVSVAIEVSSFALEATAAWAANSGADESAVVALHAGGTLAFLLVFAPVGASVLAASAAMLGSDLFPRWLGWLGVAAGVLVSFGGMIGAAALVGEGTLHDLGELPTGIGALGFWVWMIATSVIVWRRRPGRVVATSPPT